MRALPHTDSCFVCGESNPAGLKLRFETDGTIVRARFRPATEYAGFKQTVHGGIIATVLDEIMVWACAVRTRKFSFCAELNVRYASPLRPGAEAIATGELTENRRGRLFTASGELRDDRGRLIASATGKYMPIKDTDLPELLAGLVGDPGEFVDPPGQGGQDPTLH